MKRIALLSEVLHPRLWKIVPLLLSKNSRQMPKILNLPKKIRSEACSVSEVPRNPRELQHRSANANPCLVRVEASRVSHRILPVAPMGQRKILRLHGYAWLLVSPCRSVERAF